MHSFSFFTAKIFTKILRMEDLFMEMMSLEKELSSTTYPGRGIVIGLSEE